jgi:hypothetical protein
MNLKVHVLLLAVVVFSQLVIGRAAAQDEADEVLIEFNAAAIPKAALDNPLLPPRLETTRGNAALLYLRAVAIAGDLKTPMKEFRENLNKYLEPPMKDFPVEEAHKAIAPFESALGELQLASRRRSCEWQLPIEESGTGLYYVMLPEMQTLRDLARVLAVRIRVELHEGRIDAALDSLQTGYTMGRHIGDAPFLINSLVGIVGCRMMNERVLELLQSDEAPNLYWSLTALPEPLVDMRQALELESSSALMVFPELQTADDVSGEASRKAFDRMLNRFDKLAGDSTNTTGPEYALRQRFLTMENRLHTSATVMTRRSEPMTARVRQFGTDFEFGSNLIQPTQLPSKDSESLSQNHVVQNHHSVLHDFAMKQPDASTNNRPPTQTSSIRNRCRPEGRVL